MARRRRRGTGNRTAQPQQVHPNAAGLDVGATEIYAAVRAERAEQPIQSFLTYTRDLHGLADWLIACGVDTVAMESTGVYWIPRTRSWKHAAWRWCWSTPATCVRCPAARPT